MAMHCCFRPSKVLASHGRRRMKLLGAPAVVGVAPPTHLVGGTALRTTATTTSRRLLPPRPTNNVSQCTVPSPFVHLCWYHRPVQQRMQQHPWKGYYRRHYRTSRAAADTSPNSSLEWIPEAYRAPQSPSSSSSSSSPRRAGSRRGRSSTRRRPVVSSSRSARRPSPSNRAHKATRLERSRAKKAAQARDESLSDWQAWAVTAAELRRLLHTYRGALGVATSSSSGMEDWAATTTPVDAVSNEGQPLPPHAQLLTKWLDLDNDDENQHEALLDPLVQRRVLRHFLDDCAADMAIFRPPLSQTEEDSKPIPREVLADTENSFRGLCRVLQDMASAACELHRRLLLSSSSSPSSIGKSCSALAECAETSLHMLHELRMHRQELFDHWLLPQQQQQQQLHKDSPNKSKKNKGGENGEEQEPSGAEGSWIAPFSQVAHFIAESVSQISSSARRGRHSPTIFDTPHLAHKDVKLAPSQATVRLVAETIAATTAHGFWSSDSRDSHETTAQTNSTTAAASHRGDAVEQVRGLLRVLAPATVPESRTLLSIMEICCRAGTLEAAQECNRLFEKYFQDIPHLPFSMVLQAYLEASRKERIYERKREIVSDTLRIFEERWEAVSSRRRDEKVAQACTVLHCIALSGICSTDEQVLEAADKVVQRCLGKGLYKRVYGSATTVGEIVLAPHVPLVNFLARVYASSHRVPYVPRAKIMVQNILPIASVSPEDRYVRYPNVDTLNDVLEGILHLYRGNEVSDKLDQSADLVFAESLLDFAMSRRESGVWANADTFHHVMELYTCLKPANVGARMENLLAHYETRAFLYQNRDMMMSRDTYHRVLWGLWEEAKMDDRPRRTSARALAILHKLETLSTPLLLKPKQVSAIRNFQLYHFALRPTIRTYELVLNACADTAAVGEYKMAAQAALEVGTKALTCTNGFKRRIIDCVTACRDRLPLGDENVSTADLRKSLDDLLPQLEAKLASSRETGNAVSPPSS